MTRINIMGCVKNNRFSKKKFNFQQNSRVSYKRGDIRVKNSQHCLNNLHFALFYLVDLLDSPHCAAELKLRRRQSPEPRYIRNTFWLCFFASVALLYNMSHPGWGVRRKQVSPDRLRRNIPISRPSQTEGAYVQGFVCLPDFLAFMSRLLCVSPDLFAFTRFSCVHVQTFERSTKIRAFMFILSCVNQTRVRWSNFCPIKFRQEKNIQIKHNRHGIFPVSIVFKSARFCWSLARKKVVYFSIFFLHLYVKKYKSQPFSSGQGTAQMGPNSAWSFSCVDRR